MMRYYGSERVMVVRGGGCDGGHAWYGVCVTRADRTYKSTYISTDILKDKLKHT